MPPLKLAAPDRGPVCPVRKPPLLLSSRITGGFATREKGGNCLVPDPDYMVDALKIPNRAPRVSASNGPVVDSRDLNLVFGHTEATSNK
ncbi:hypothetical protein TNCV_4256201 [Trichonephila clavipes]|nr:hypothetical protein TNCV_4256201 [Trichonephila clavipes]